MGNLSSVRAKTFRVDSPRVGFGVGKGGESGLESLEVLVSGGEEDRAPKPTGSSSISDRLKRNCEIMNAKAQVMQHVQGACDLVNVLSFDRIGERCGHLLSIGEHTIRREPRDVHSLPLQSVPMAYRAIHSLQPEEDLGMAENPLGTLGGRVGQIGVLGRSNFALVLLTEGKDLLLGKGRNGCRHSIE